MDPLDALPPVPAGPPTPAPPARLERINRDEQHLPPRQQKRSGHHSDDAEDDEEDEDFYETSPPLEHAPGPVWPAATEPGRTSDDGLGQGPHIDIIA